MANTERRYIDRSGKMFIPMNVEGGTWNENFIDTKKLVTIAIIAGSGVILGITLSDSNAGVSNYLMMFGLWFFVSSLALRFIVFEEKYYHKIYKQLEKYKITTPALFWDIASINNTPDGAILTYSDMRTAVILRLERDTITGKPGEFIETHYDAISDFYKEIVQRKYSFVQLNLMEPAGNDPRLGELDKLVHKNSNINIRKLMEKQIGHIKNITRDTLYESEYFLIYTNDITRMDSIIDDCEEIAYKILDGAYIGFRILGVEDIVQIVQEEYGVGYFNYTDAITTMFEKNGIETKKPFDIVGVIYTTGEEQSLNSEARNKIQTITSGIINGTIDNSKISFKNTLSINNNKKQEGVNFGDLSKGFGGMETKEKRGKGEGKKKEAKGKKEELKGKSMEGFTAIDGGLFESEDEKGRIGDKRGKTEAIKEKQVEKEVGKEKPIDKGETKGKQIEKEASKVSILDIFEDD